MPFYTDRQAWFADAFLFHRTRCSAMCSCGQTHFVSAMGHGDYEPGELEEFQRKAKESPDKYYEHCDFDSIDVCEIDGKDIIPDCPCGGIEKYCDWIEENANALATYLQAFLQQRMDDAEESIKQDTKLLEGVTPPHPKPITEDAIAIENRLRSRVSEASDILSLLSNRHTHGEWEAAAMRCSELLTTYRVIREDEALFRRLRDQENL